MNHHRKPIPSEESGDRFSLPDGPVQSIGQYEHAVRIYDGLFSSIFCSKPLPGDTRYLLLALKVTPFCGVSPPHDPFREARILAQIPPHSNILPILDKFNIPDNFVLLTPHYPFHLAGSLEKGVINDESGLSIMRDVFCGLAHIHALDIIHRDIKPSNILLKSATGGAVIADFGIAWKEGDPSSEKSEEKISDIGTTCYRAPELLFGYHSYGPSADMWAAGCVFAEVMDVEHRPLFEAGDLGSELRLLSDMFQKIGTPTTESWPVSAQIHCKLK